MIEGRNVVILTGGIVRDPEVVNGSIAKFSVAVDFGGSEKGGSNTGYFDVTYFLNGDENKRNASFVSSQINEGKMKKGSQISLVGRLVQERWTDDNGNRSKVVVVAESISYASGAARPTTGEASASAGEASVVITDF